MQGLQNQLKELLAHLNFQRKNKEKQAMTKVANGQNLTDELIKEILLLDKQQKTIQQLLGDNVNSPQESLSLMSNIQNRLSQSSLEYVATLGDIPQSKQSPITAEQITNKRTQLSKGEDDEQDGWTDESSMVNDEFDDGIIFVDDEIAAAMDESVQQQQKQPNEEESEEYIDDLEEEFVKDGKSDHNKLLTGHSKFVVSLAIDKKNKRLASGGGDDILNIYDVAELQNEKVQMKPIQSFKEGETVSIVRFSHNGEFAVGTTDKCLSVINCKTWQRKQIEMEDCKSISMHPQGNLCMVGSGHQIHLYNLNNCSLYNTYYAEKEVTITEFAPGGKHLVVGCRGQLKVIQPKTQQSKRIEGHNFHQQQIVCMDFKDNIVLSGSVDGYACMSNWMTGAPLSRSQLHTNSVENVLFFGNLFLTGCVDGLVRWYDANSMKKVNNYQFNGAVTKMLRIEQTSLVGVSTFSGQICLMDPRVYNDKKIVSAGSTIHDMAEFDRGLLVACEDGLIKYFDTRLI